MFLANRMGTEKTCSLNSLSIPLSVHAYSSPVPLSIDHIPLQAAMLPPSMASEVRQGV